MLHRYHRRLEENNSRLLNFFVRKRNWVAVTKSESTLFFLQARRKKLPNQLLQKAWLLRLAAYAVKVTAQKCKRVRTWFPAKHSMTVRVAINGFGRIGDHNPHSSNYDLTQTQIVNDRLVRVLSWYDNEWGFSCRMCDTTVALAKLL